MDYSDIGVDLNELFGEVVGDLLEDVNSKSPIESTYDADSAQESITEAVTKWEGIIYTIKSLVDDAESMLETLNTVEGYIEDIKAHYENIDDCNSEIESAIDGINL